MQLRLFCFEGNDLERLMKNSYLRNLYHLRQLTVGICIICDSKRLEIASFFVRLKGFESLVLIITCFNLLCNTYTK